MLDVGSGDVALEEPAGASVAQADWFTVTDAERGQHQGQHGDDLGVHGVGGRARRRLQSWTARGGDSWEGVCDLWQKGILVISTYQYAMFLNSL